MFTNVKDKKKYIRNYIKWQKEFVNGNQLTEPCVFDGSTQEIEKQFYWQSDRCYNLIKTTVDRWRKSFPESKLWGPGKAVDQLIPYQREYNLLMNRITELTRRITFPVLCVEDGSVDTDELGEEGLAPGKIIVYRQGSKCPTLMNTDPTMLVEIESIAKRIKEELNELMCNLEANL